MVLEVVKLRRGESWTGSADEKERQGLAQRRGRGGESEGMRISSITITLSLNLSGWNFCILDTGLSHLQPRIKPIFRHWNNIAKGYRAQHPWHPHLEWCQGGAWKKCTGLPCWDLEHSSVNQKEVGSLMPCQSDLKLTIPKWCIEIASTMFIRPKKLESLRALGLNTNCLHTCLMSSCLYDSIIITIQLNNKFNALLLKSKHLYPTMLAKQL